MKNKQYLVKDGNGEYVAVVAGEVEWSGNGLKFSRDGKVVALFLAWMHWREVADAP